MTPYKLDSPVPPAIPNNETSNGKSSDTVSNKSVKRPLVWLNIVNMTNFHIGSIYGIYLIVTRQVMWPTAVFCYVLAQMTSALGITGSAHRLWAHKSYKARWPLRLIFVLFNSMTLQGPVINWVRDHRMHHRYSETDADPHNSKRGLWYCHIGWIFVRKHPEYMAKVHTIDSSDLWADPMLRFQKQYYFFMWSFTNMIPVYIATLWGETVLNAFIVCVLLRITYGLHCVFLVNSAAHMWGNRPYDKTMAPVENKFVSHFMVGEGFHNYHHTFPWDYKAEELSGNYGWNLTALFIDLMAKLGLAYDLKTVDPEVIKKRAERTGDGTYTEQ
ncbi:fatty acid desaturase domain-containing protein [Phthorimaea operculella]|nr:fatty acid desaturase domain-containing protein [Phthorimaea operculella]